MLLKQLMYNAENNIPMKLSPCGQICDYLYEDDAGASFVAAAKSEIDGKTYVLGSGEGRPLKDYIQDVIFVVNPNYKPEFGKILYSSTRPMCLVADVNDTGWTKRISFKNGVFFSRSLHNGTYW